MNYTIEANGNTYKHVAWTGGDTPPQDFPQTPDERELVEAFYLDQYSDYNSKQPLPSDVHAVFLNRARLDAWRTLHP